MEFSQVSHHIPETEEQTFKEAVCSLLECTPEQYEKVVFRNVVFFRTRFIGFFVGIFYPDFHFQEQNLIRQVAQNTTMTEMQTDIDFYQHKHVSNSVRRDAMGIRLSGKKMMSLASRAFAASRDISVLQ
jgi:hypothetical protein